MVQSVGSPEDVVVMVWMKEGLEAKEKGSREERDRSFTMTVEEVIVVVDDVG